MTKLLLKGVLVLFCGKSGIFEFIRALLLMREVSTYQSLNGAAFVAGPSYSSFSISPEVRHSHFARIPFDLQFETIKGFMMSSTTIAMDIARCFIEKYYPSLTTELRSYLELTGPISGHMRPSRRSCHLGQAEVVGVILVPFLVGLFTSFIFELIRPTIFDRLFKRERRDESAALRKFLELSSSKQKKRVRKAKRIVTRRMLKVYTDTSQTRKLIDRTITYTLERVSSKEEAEDEGIVEDQKFSC